MNPEFCPSLISVNLCVPKTPHELVRLIADDQANWLFVNSV